VKTIPTTKQTIEYLKKRLDEMPLDGKYSVEIKKVKSKRSIDQNALYWAWMTYIASEFSGTRTDKEYYHNHFKSEYLPAVVKDILGKQVRCYKSTSDLTTEEFTEYLSRIEADMLKVGYELPKVLGKQYDQMMEVYG
jgi:hypothetical protein